MPSGCPPSELSAQFWDLVLSLNGKGIILYQNIRRWEESDFFFFSVSFILQFKPGSTRKHNSTHERSTREQTIWCEIPALCKTSATKPEMESRARQIVWGWLVGFEFLGKQWHSPINPGDFCSRQMGLVISCSLTGPLWVTHSATLRDEANLSNLGPAKPQASQVRRDSWLQHVG